MMEVNAARDLRLSFPQVSILNPVLPFPLSQQSEERGEDLPSSPIRSGISNATCQGPIEVSDQWGGIGVFGTGEAAVRWWLVSDMDGLSSGD